MDPSHPNLFVPRVTSSEPANSSLAQPVGSRRFTRHLYLVSVAWFFLVCLTGLYADNGRYSLSIGITAAVGALLAIMCLLVSLRSWQHLLAIPLYLCFIVELLVFAALFVPR